MEKLNKILLCIAVVGSFSCKKGALVNSSQNVLSNKFLGRQGLAFVEETSSDTLSDTVNLDIVALLDNERYKNTVYFIQILSNPQRDTLIKSSIGQIRLNVHYKTPVYIQLWGKNINPSCFVDGMKKGKKYKVIFDISPVKNEFIRIMSDE